MPIRVECPTCGAEFRVGDARLGTTVRCQGCGRPVACGEGERSTRDDAQPAVHSKSARRKRSADDQHAPPQRVSPGPRRSPMIWVGAAGVGVGGILLAVLIVVLATGDSSNGNLDPGDNQINIAGDNRAVKQPPWTAKQSALQKKPNQADAELPPPTPIDLSAVKVVKIADAPTLRYEPDAEEPCPALLAEIKLPRKGRHVRRILFSRPALAQAALLFSSAADEESFSVDVDRVELTTGKVLGSWKLFTGTRQKASARRTAEEIYRADADLSQDGGRLAVLAPDESRMAVFSLEDGRPIVSWHPYRAERGAQKISWFGFVDSDHVLTLNDGGKLILWRIPDCRAIYQVNDIKCDPAFSGQRKSVLVCNGARLAILDAKTGECRRRFEPDRFRLEAYKSACFRRDGQEVVVLQGYGLCQVTRWDLTTGAPRETMDLAHAVRVQYLQSGRILADSGRYVELIDGKLQAPVVCYTLTHGGAAIGSPDGQFWFFATSIRDQDWGTLKAMTDLDGRIEKEIRWLGAQSLKKALICGTPVKIQITSSNQDFHATALATMRELFQKCRLREGDGGVTFTMEIREFGQGMLKLARPRGAPLLIARKSVNVKSAFFAADGARIDSHEEQINPPPLTKEMLAELQASQEDAAKIVNDLLWQEVQARITNLPLGHDAYRINGRIAAWPHRQILSH